MAVRLPLLSKVLLYDLDIFFCSIGKICVTVAVSVALPDVQHPTDSGIYITIHGHFYQPPRENPYINEIERQESAAGARPDAILWPRAGGVPPVP